MLERSAHQIEDAGYVPDTNSVLYNVEEEQKEQSLCYLSAKLAIVFGLLRTADEECIHFNKILHVFCDFHTPTKFISKFTGQMIIIQDANGIHHFKDGLYSCGDY